MKVMNRTFCRAERLAAQLGGVAAPFEELPAQLDQADLVVSATGSPDYVLEGVAVAEAMDRRQGRPLLPVDIAMPRDIDPAAGEIPGVQLFDIDSLRMATESTDGTLDQEMTKVEDIVREETDEFLKWRQSLDTVPLISTLRDQAEEFRRAELARTLGKLRGQWSSQGAGYGFDQLATQLESMTSALVKKLLHYPTIYLREGGDPLRQQVVREVFNIDGANFPRS